MMYLHAQMCTYYLQHNYVHMHAVQLASSLLVHIHIYEDVCCLSVQCMIVAITFCVYTHISIDLPIQCCRRLRGKFSFWISCD